MKIKLQIKGKPIVYACGECGHNFSKYAGDAIEYHKEFYRKNPRHQRVKGEFRGGKVTQKFHRARRRIVSGRMVLVSKYLKKNYSCLDVGAGAGTFAHKIKDKVNDVECTELDPSLISECKRLGFKSYSGDFSNLHFDKKFDIVFAWHVLEHVRNVKPFLDNMRDISRRLFILEIPVTNLRRKFDGHFHKFTHKSLEMCLNSSGFKIIETKSGIQKPAIFAVCEIC
tara:strand:+ start:8205 stop:8882 length:678 start_codon:yes stop_codon:yes gene_type:complete